MPSKAPDGSQIVSTRLPEALLQRLDRYLDWSETSRRVKSSRNAAIREALSTWLDYQEQLAGLVHPDTLQRQFWGAYDRLSPRRDWVPIHRLRQQLQWPHERFDAVLEGLRAARLVELDGVEPGAMSDRDIQDSYVVHGHLYRMLRWCS
jgi:hypothetical protein